jgi:GNAT superfamily N-acetyltransferase
MIVYSVSVILNKMTSSATIDPSRLEIKVVSGRDLLPHMETLARLRISVFRAFPYLYDGDMEYEKKYLSTYMNKPDAMTVLVLDGGKAVGASTALPLIDETDEVIRPFVDKGIVPEEVFYLGESVLEPAYRGMGLGVRFFEEREKYARMKAGAPPEGKPWRRLAFCAVKRPAGHPMRPAGYVPLDRFWENRGYRKQPGMQTTFSWRDLGDAGETRKPMTFWLKELVK